MRNDGIADDLGSRGAGSLDSFEHLRLNLLDGIGEQLGEHADLWQRAR